ncbi:fatty acid desaturase [Thermocoleostomius sinensis]|uniref:Fatty acid desaturase n=1 Tax=Thermocoleostomius sinensis A174 TaxID=2016057 RepID=A0A9E9CA43_9CYAN|nr:fatty acid desaturase [Thermocoleostomius sinensis]WAL62373.1 fatty acid desaturase [Thermocoleostomius sinensis A174]
MTATTEKFATPSISSADTALRLNNVQLKDIIKTLPRECFEKNRRKAWTSVFISVLAVSVGYVAIATSPWFLLPLAWFFTGTALTGFFVIAHDCGHRSFAKRRWVNDWVGQILMLPLIYPFHSWRILHNHHHLHTNKLAIDNAWQPWTAEEYTETHFFMRKFYEALRGRLWWLASVAHWAKLHFDLTNFTKRDRQKVKTSIIAVVLFAGVFFPTLIATTGLWGFIKFWLMPWLGYHFWMSTFTLVHHTAPDIQFEPIEHWNAAEAQLAGTVHCTYPRWVELLCHDINVHVPHHISVAIPSYNLRTAHRSLKHHWGSHIQEAQFSWALMKVIVEYCHLYHPEKAYQPFHAVKIPAE